MEKNIHRRGSWPSAPRPCPLFVDPGSATVTKHRQQTNQAVKNSSDKVTESRPPSRPLPRPLGLVSSLAPVPKSFLGLWQGLRVFNPFRLNTVEYEFYFDVWNQLNEALREYTIGCLLGLIAVYIPQFYTKRTIIWLLIAVIIFKNTKFMLNVLEAIRLKTSKNHFSIIVLY